MPKIVFLPHQDLCPDGIVVEAVTGETILDAALRSGIEIEHACEKSCACTTCHCIVREGFDSAKPCMTLTRISTRKPFALPTCISGFAIWKSLMMIQTHPMKKFSRRFC